MWTILAVNLAIFLGLAVPPATAAGGSPADRASEFESARLMSLVRNLCPSLHWIGDSDRFWVRNETAEGTRFVVVDAASGRQTPAFGCRHRRSRTLPGSAQA